MTYLKKIKLKGKTVKSSKKKEIPDSAVTLSTQDLEVTNKIEELHIFLTQRGLPYIIVTQTPTTKQAINRFSFNTEHNTPQKTVANAEWIFSNIGSLTRHITQGLVQLIKFY